MKKYIILPFTILLLLTIFSACMGATPISQPNPNFAADLVSPPPTPTPTPSPTPLAQTPPAPRTGGQLNIAMSIPATLNPLLNSDPWVDNVLRLIFEPLVVFEADGRPVANPAIVQSIVFSPEGGSLAISLRDDVTWEDGTPITSDDINFSIDTLRRFAPQSAIYKQNVAQIQSTRIIDARSLQINFNTHAWTIKYALAFPIIPAEYYRTTSMTNLSAARNMHPLGNGPFRFYDYEAAGRLELIASSAAPGGRPLVDRVSAIIIRDITSSEIHAFEQGLTDAFVAAPQDGGRYAAIGKRRAADFTGNTFDFIGFNSGRTIFADFEVRAAIAHSFDFAAVSHYFSAEDAAITPIHPTSWLAASNLASYPFDTDHASALFGRLGFAPGSDGILQRRLSEVLPSVRLSFDILVNEDNAHGMAIAQVLSSGLHEAGAEAAITALPFSQYLEAVNAGDFDIVVGGMAASDVPNLSFLAGNNNNLQTIFGFNSEELNLLLHMMDHAVTEGNFREAAAAVQHYVADNLPMMGVAFRRQVLYTAPHVHGDISVVGGNKFASITGWFIAE